MATPAYQTIKRVYLEARGLQGDERRAFLERECAGAADLRTEVQNLLDQEETLGGFLERPAARELGGEPDQEPVSHPERIGAYRVLKPLGWGGMGVVYLAEQDSPKRSVALKLLRFDSASPNQVARFEREAELLGRLSHPGIARVYEAGWAETETGRRPFFAMEFVEGHALHEYVNENKLDLQAKIELVCRVAEAAHYAHERGVVHRDLKPTNVLIDQRGDPKVLDFGVARPLGTDSSATQTGQLVGTLAYMSPEQATGHGAIDARCDVYSLGVILYELLTGRLPVATEALALHEAVRRVREEEPIAAGSVRRELRGDLETVLDKALAKEPGRRYASAAEFSEDLRLYLDQRPIRARRPTSLYVAWKLVRRHRALAGTAVALFLALSVAQYVSLVLIERGKQVRMTESARDFWRELANSQSVLDDIKSVQLRAGLLLDDGFTPPPAKLEEWLAEVGVLEGRLEEFRSLRERRARQGLAYEPGTIASAEEKEYAQGILDDIVEDLEAMKGPRGSIPRVRARLEELRGTSPSGEQATEGGG